MLFEGFVAFMLLGISARIFIIGNSIRADIRELGYLLAGKQIPKTQQPISFIREWLKK